MGKIFEKLGDYFSIDIISPENLASKDPEKQMELYHAMQDKRKKIQGFNIFVNVVGWAIASLSAGSISAMAVASVTNVIYGAFTCMFVSVIVFALLNKLTLYIFHVEE